MLQKGQIIIMMNDGVPTAMEVKGLDDNVVVLFDIGNGNGNGKGLVVERKSLEENLILNQGR